MYKRGVATKRKTGLGACLFIAGRTPLWRPATRSQGCPGALFTGTESRSTSNESIEPRKTAVPLTFVRGGRAFSSAKSLCMTHSKTQRSPMTPPEQVRGIEGWSRKLHSYEAHSMKKAPVRNGSTKKVVRACPTLHGSQHRRTSAKSGLRENPVMPLLRWSTHFEDAGRLATMTIPGPSHVERESLLSVYLDPRYAAVRPDVIEDVLGDRTRTWLEIGAVESFLRRVATLQLPPSVQHGLGLSVATEWQLIWALIQAEPFLIDEPLRTIVDHPWYLVSDVHKALWEARFLFRENEDKTKVAAFIGAMTRWMMGRDLTSEDIEQLSKAGVKRRLERDEERLDVACFLLTLAAQNGVLNRIVMSFDGIEKALRPDGRPMLRQLLGVVRVVERWVQMGGSPIGLFVGAPSGKPDMTHLRRLAPALHERVNAGLEWTR